MRHLKCKLSDIDRSRVAKNCDCKSLYNLWQAGIVLVPIVCTPAASNTLAGGQKSTSAIDLRTLFIFTPCLSCRKYHIYSPKQWMLLIIIWSKIWFLEIDRKTNYHATSRTSGDGNTETSGENERCDIHHTSKMCENTWKHVCENMNKDVKCALAFVASICLLCSFVCLLHFCSLLELHWHGISNPEWLLWHCDKRLSEKAKSGCCRTLVAHGNVRSSCRS